jgi:hypothetical protein
MAFKDGAVQKMVALVGARTQFEKAVVPSRAFAACQRGCRIEAISVQAGLDRRLFRQGEGDLLSRETLRLPAIPLAIDLAQESGGADSCMG